MREFTTHLRHRLCSAAVSAAVVGRPARTSEGRMPSRQPARCRRYTRKALRIIRRKTVVCATAEVNCGIVKTLSPVRMVRKTGAPGSRPFFER